MLDLAIRGGAVVDGTGAPRRAADLGIRDGRVVEISKSVGAARQTIQADGQVVSPGFVDVHTHYDAQAFWDGSLSPSSFHGVTTVIAGNCGFSIAPLSGRSEDAEYLLHMLARVEGMPVKSLQQGVPWNWTSFGEFLGKLEGKLAINAGFMVGHSALRRAVMGARAVGHQATPEELARIQALLRRSIEEGGLGFSTTVSPTHNDADGNPVPSRHASDEELETLAGTLRDLPGTTLEVLPTPGQFSDFDIARMIRLSRAANRQLNWNLLSPDSRNPAMMARNLSASDQAAAQGAGVVALAIAQPVTVWINFSSMFLLDSIPGWYELSKLAPAERMQALADPATRARLDRDAHSDDAPMFRMLADWPAYTLSETFSPSTKPFQGMTVGEVAQRQGKTPFDALLDIVVADGLKTSLAPPPQGADDESWRMRVAAWRDPRTIIGGSDAGAHLDMIDTFAFATKVLGDGMRKRGLVGLEEAVQMLTQAPAGLIGLKDRGTIAEGAIADLVVFDETRIGCGPTHTRFDLPGGAGRLYAEAEGIAHVVVNGREAIRGQTLVDATAGQILRSGRDTYTVAVGK